LSQPKPASSSCRAFVSRIGGLRFGGKQGIRLSDQHRKMCIASVKASNARALLDSNGQYGRRRIRSRRQSRDPISSDRLPQRDLRFFRHGVAAEKQKRR
jgi:hypothetical protein